MDLEAYVIEIENFGKFELDGRNIFTALDQLKEDLCPDSRFKILSAHIIKNGDFLIDITESLNGIQQPVLISNAEPSKV